MEQTNNAPSQPAAEVKKASGEKISAIAVMCYIGPLFIIPFLTKEKDEFVIFHAKQGMVLFLCEIVISFLGGAIPLFGWSLAAILNLVMIALAIIGIMNVVKHEKTPLPVIGTWADKFKI